LSSKIYFSFITIFNYDLLSQKFVDLFQSSFNLFPGLAVTAVIVQQSDSFSVAPLMSLQRNVSFSTKRGVAGIGAANQAKGAGMVRIFGGSPGQTLGLDLAVARSPTVGGGSEVYLPEDVHLNYKDAIFNYSRCREAGIMEMEASLKV